MDNIPHWYPLQLHNYQATPLPTPTPLLSPQGSFREDRAGIDKAQGKYLQTSQKDSRSWETPIKGMFKASKNDTIQPA